MANLGLFIGINYSGSQHQLAGCINDARDWAQQFGPWMSAKPVMLLEQQAVKNAIVAEISRLCSALKPGDTGIITFSGHGTYIPDRDGDEPDRRDEALCPFDLQNSLLLDDELRMLLGNRVAGSKVLLITDCCHSGTMSRAPIITDSPRPNEPPRYIPFSALTACMCCNTVDRITSQVRASRQAIFDNSNLIHLAGCQDDQVSYDATIAGKACGAFTHYALAALKARKTPGMTYAEWQAAIRPHLPSNRYPQSPAFSGDLSGVVPGFEAAAPVAPTAMPDGTLYLGGKLYDVKERK